jgi:hypothetical protein
MKGELTAIIEAAPFVPKFPGQTVKARPSWTLRKT